MAAVQSDKDAGSAMAAVQSDKDAGSAMAAVQSDKDAGSAMAAVQSDKNAGSAMAAAMAAIASSSGIQDAVRLRSFHPFVAQGGCASWPKICHIDHVLVFPDPLCPIITP